MSCYIRHMSEVLEKAGISNSKENRSKIDHFLKEKYELPVNVRSCPEVWKIYIKPILSDEDKTTKFIAELKNAIKNKAV